MTRRWVFGVAAAMIVCMLGGCTHGGKQGDTTDLEEVLFTDAQTEAIDPSEYPQMQYDAQNDWYWIEGVERIAFLRYRMNRLRLERS